METIKDSGRIIRSYNARRTMIICDKTTLKSGHTHEVINALIAQNIKYELYSNVGIAYEEQELQCCLNLAESSKVDSIVMIGDDQVKNFSHKFLDLSQQDYPVHEIKMPEKLPA